MTASGPLGELGLTAALPFGQARAMPPSVYTAPEFLAREQAEIFRKEWVCIGRSETLGQPGDYVACEIAGQPVIVLRDKAGDIRAMSNVCLHRMSVLLEGTGNLKTITCPYHAWVYNLDGSLRGAPQMTRNAGFRKADYCLPQIRSETWLGWIYVTLNPEAAPIAKRLAPLTRLIKRYRMERYVETFRETHLWNTNWKVLAENYMESYHLPICHNGTVGPHTALEGVDCPPGEAMFNIHWFPKDEGLGIGTAHPRNRRLKGVERTTSAILSIYPSHLVTLTPGYFWYLSLQPVAPGRVHMIYGGGFAPEYIADPEAEAHSQALQELLREVNLEDRKCTEAVYRGLSAGLSRPGHLSHLERPVYDFARYLAQRVGAPDPTA